MDQSLISKVISIRVFRNKTLTLTFILLIFCTKLCQQLSSINTFSEQCFVDYKNSRIGCEVESLNYLQIFFNNLSNEQNVTLFKIFDLSGPIQQFNEPNVFGSIQFEKIYFSFTPELRDISSDAFGESNVSTVMTFQIGSNFDSYLTAEQLFGVMRKFTRIENANLNMSPGQNLESSICNSQTLSQLSFHGSRSIASIYNNAFSDCINLTKIDLSNISIKNIYQNSFLMETNMPMVEFHLRNCSLKDKTFEEISLNTATSLYLNFEDNLLEELYLFGSFLITNAKNSVNLRNNPINCDDPNHIQYIQHVLFKFNSRLVYATCANGIDLWEFIKNQSHTTTTSTSTQTTTKRTNLPTTSTTHISKPTPTTTTTTTRKVPNFSSTTTPTTKATTLSTTTQSTSTLPSDQEIDDVIEEIENLQNQTDINTSPINSTIEFDNVIHNLAAIFHRITDGHLSSQINVTVAHKMTDKSLLVMNNLIESVTVWKQMNHSVRIDSFGRISKLNANISRFLNLKQKKRDLNFILKYSSIHLQSNLFQVNSNESIMFDIWNTQIELPGKSLIQNDNRLFAVTASIIKNISSYLPVHKEVYFNSDIISVVVGNPNKSTKLYAPFRFRILNKEPLVFGDKPKCTFWKHSSKDWLEAGCYLVELHSTRKTTVCECNHLTDFAILVDISGQEGPSRAKSVLTIVCSSITVVCIVLALFISLKYNKESFTLMNDQFRFKSNKFRLNFNILIWLLVSHLLIVFGLDLTYNKLTCEMTSLFLLFSLLTTFTFIFLQTFNLYLSTSNPFSINMKFYYYIIAGYGIPVLIIAAASILIAITETRDILSAFIGEYFCWISSLHYPYNIWIFVGPITIYVVMNIVLLFFILRSIFRSRRKTTNQSSTSTIRNSLQTISIILFIFNFGILWILYIFYINRYFNFFSYIFIVVNGTQGLPFLIDQLLYFYFVRKTRRYSSNPRQSQNTYSRKKSSILQSGVTKSTELFDSK